MSSSIKSKQPLIINQMKMLKPQNFTDHSNDPVSPVLIVGFVLAFVACFVVAFLIWWVCHRKFDLEN